MNSRGPVFCDITELATNPVRTGIQRVVREAIRHWDSPRPLQLCWFDPSQEKLQTLPDAISYYLLEPDELTRANSIADNQRSIAQLLDNWTGEDVALGETILLPEVFFDEHRCRHHIWRINHNPDRVFALFHDFIPWLAPDSIGVRRSHPLMWYLHLAQLIQQAAFNSAATCNDWNRRIRRNAITTGTVLPLGADGLHLKKQHFSKDKRTFVALGSIDGRKNQLSIMRAFKRLWADGFPFGLTLIGRVFAAEDDIRTEMESCAQFPMFRHIEAATDAEVGEVLSRARATIYASTLEGYGLPPIESLYAGIPCIASKRIPSMQGVERGAKFFDEPTPEGIATEVQALSGDREAKQIWDAAAKLKLPTWKDFGKAIARFVDGESKSTHSGDRSL